MPGRLPLGHRHPIALQLQCAIRQAKALAALEAPRAGGYHPPEHIGCELATAFTVTQTFDWEATLHGCSKEFAGWSLLFG